MIETFLMERMQSTYENVVDYDLSESGVRPVTLREMVSFGFDLDALMDSPSATASRNGTIELRERIAAMYPGATINHVEVTNGTSEANYILALTLLRAGDVVALQVPNYLQFWGVPRSLGATVERFELQRVDGVVGRGLGGVRASRHAEDALRLRHEPEQSDGCGALAQVRWSASSSVSTRWARI